MRILIKTDPWPTTPEEAEAVQGRLAPLVDVSAASPVQIRYVAGLDVAYSDVTDRVVGAVVVFDADTLEVVESQTAVSDVEFPYTPGLLAFRELPALFQALEKLTVEPDVLVADGYGIAHPRRFGLACHLGVATGKPAFGVGKTAFIGEYGEPGPERGDVADLTDGGEIVGRVLRTQKNVKPVFVSAGHLIDLDTASALTLRLSPKYRLPETTRRADQLSRIVLGRAAFTSPS
jgi:deoxyribonuclease V